MDRSVAIAANPALDELALAPPARAWRDWLAPALSLVVAAACIWALYGLDWRAVAAAVPASPLYWLAFAVLLAVQPGFDWLIFRRLWALPADGVVPLLRKFVGNEVLLGYAGDAYFYAWARRRLGFVAAPFGAIKDSAILSGFAGNIATLAVLAVAWPFFHELRLTVGEKLAIVSIAAVTAMSVGVLVFGGRLFSLPRAALRDVFLLHLARIGAAIMMTGVLWHIALPTAPAHWWVLLAAIRMLVSRLPFVPNKEVVFAGLAVVLVGRDAAVSEMIAALAGLTLGAQVLIGLPLMLTELISPARD